jgi:hypothetical protein
VSSPTITYQLRETIIGDLGLRPPPDKEFAMLVAWLRGVQFCNEPDVWDVHTKTFDEHGRLLRRSQTPAWLRLTFDVEARAIGHPRPRRGNARLTHRRPKKWRDFAGETAERFRAMYPEREFGERDGVLASFVYAAMRLTFPGRGPRSAGAVGQFLARQRKRQ